LEAKENPSIATTPFSCDRMPSPSWSSLFDGADEEPTGAASTMRCVQHATDFSSPKEIHHIEGLYHL
jgi:hypothetical protein